MQQREVRRQDKIVTNREWMDSILQRGQILTLAMVEENGCPYLVSTSYGYDKQAIYLHGAAQGKKVETLTANPKVCFQVVLDTEIVRHETIPSKFTWKYRSVTGFGRVCALESLDEKNHALKVLMQQYNGPYVPLEASSSDYIWVARLDIEHITGKTSVYPQP